MNLLKRREAIVLFYKAVTRTGWNTVSFLQVGFRGEKSLEWVSWKRQGELGIFREQMKQRGIVGFQIWQFFLKSQIICSIDFLNWRWHERQQVSFCCKTDLPCMCGYTFSLSVGKQGSKLNKELVGSLPLLAFKRRMNESSLLLWNLSACNWCSITACMSTV